MLTSVTDKCLCSYQNSVYQDYLCDVLKVAGIYASNENTTYSS